MRQSRLPTEQVTTLCELFRLRAAAMPSAPAYRDFSSELGWRSYDWQTIATDVGSWQAALQAVGLVPGDRVAIMLHNSVDWVRFDQAALGLGLVVVPLYMQDRPENSAYVLNDCGAQLLLLEALDQWQQIEATGHLNTKLLRVVVQRGVDHATGPQPESAETLGLTEWLGQHSENLGAGVQTRVTDPDSLATIVYTSGTTGRPKGVMLSHRNIISNLIAADQLNPLFADDLLLSFLPLSHTLERTVGYYLPMFAGSEVAFSRGVAELTEDLQQIRPTVLVSVPRVFERANNAVRARLATKPKWLQRLFDYTLDLGWQKFEHQQQPSDKPPTTWLLPLLLRLFGRPVLNAMGGRLRFAVCGGAPLSLNVARTFTALGLPLLQGYGLTETSPIISGNSLPANRPQSVGRIIDGVEVKIGDLDEILCRGPNVMQGYWNNSEATDAVIDSAGWLHTGDCGRVEEGFLYITGRLKEIIVLANGEKIPPAEMEHAIEHDPLIEQCMVIGEGEPYLAALVVVSSAELARINQQQQPSLAAADGSLQQELVARIAVAIAAFPGYANRHRVACSMEQWDTDNGLLTPTLKLKRGVIEAHFSDQIPALYAGH